MRRLILLAGMLAWAAPAFAQSGYSPSMGSLKLVGPTSGTVTVQPQTAAGTWNFNLPITAGSAGQPLLSGGGGSTAMSWGARSGNTTTFVTSSGTLTSGHCAAIDSSGNLVDAGAACSAGTVSSVALSLPAALFTVSGSPVTTTGTLTGTLASQAANEVFASPNGSSGTPGFRSLVAADLPNSGVTPGTYGDGTHVAAVAVDGYGRVTSASNVTITGAAPTGSAGGALAGTYPNPTLAAEANNTVIGNVSGGSAAPTALTATQLTTLCNTFTSVLSGCVSASGGGTTNFLRADGTWAAVGGGTVTSVGLSLPAMFTVTNSPVTTSGTLTATLASETANTFLAAPNGSAGSPTFRTIAAGDLPATAVSAGSYGDGTHVGAFTVDAAGRLTAASSVAITGAAPTGSASGDLSGTYPGPTVAKINGATLGTTTATSGNILVGSGSSWGTAAVSGDATLANTGALTVTKTSGTNFGACATACVNRAIVLAWNSTTTVTADTYRVLPYAPAAGTISAVKYLTNGSSTPSFGLAVKINGTNVTSCNGITVSSSSLTSTTCTAANTFSAGDVLTVVTSSISGTPNDAVVEVMITWGG